MTTKTTKITAIVLVMIFVFVLSGCITLPDLTPTPKEPKPTPLVMETDSFAKMCKEARDNDLRAKDRYRGKGLTVKGKIHSINIEKPGLPAGVSITAGYVNIVKQKQTTVIIGLEAKDKQVIKRVSMDETITGSGVISSVGYRPNITFDSCIIILEDATF